jgi:L-aminopeptidase/D-esterase-like protein
VSAWGPITDVPGVLVGHYQRTGRGWRTGTTALIVPEGATPGVDVRGGGPGTRETDALRPENLVPAVNAVCLTGGSAYGLAAADGVAAWLEERRLGFPVGREDQPDWVVPIVPAAVIFDLGRAGRFTHRPTAEFGRRAAERARGSSPRRGAVGAATGAVGGGLQGGVGTAAVVVDGIAVGALAVNNASGRVVDPGSGLPWCTEGFDLRRPPASERAAVRAATAPPVPDAQSPTNTTIGVVATSAALTKAECARLATVAHDGIARAVRPAHGMFDGDTVFALATGRDPLPDDAARYRAAETRAARLDQLLDAAARCFAAAVTDAVISARSVGGPPAYRELCPGAFGKTASTSLGFESSPRAHEGTSHD